LRYTTSQEPVRLQYADNNFVKSLQTTVFKIDAFIFLYLQVTMALVPGYSGSSLSSRAGHPSGNRDYY